MASPLGKLFGRSPIAPIQQHMQLAEETVQLLCEVLTACADQEFLRAEEILRLMDTSVADAAKKRRDIRQHLPRGLMLAMPRPDLLELLNIQTRLAEHARECAIPLVVRKMSFPATTQRLLDQYASLLAAAAGQALAAIRNLDELLTQGFGNHERKTMEKMIATLDKQLRRCGTQQQKLLRQIARSEGSQGDLDVMFQYQLAERLVQLAKACSDIGEQLELLIAK